MINYSYPNYKTLIISVLRKSISFRTLKECRKNFIINALICFSSIKGKINFLQIERFSNKCEQYFKVNFENKLIFISMQHELLSIQQKFTGWILESRIPSLSQWLTLSASLYNFICIGAYQTFTLFSKLNNLSSRELYLLPLYPNYQIIIIFACNCLRISKFSCTFVKKICK